MLVSEPLITTLPDGRTLETLYACDICHAPMLPVHGNHRVCGREECQAARLMVYERSRSRPLQYYVQKRDYLRRDSTHTNYWSRGAPVYGSHLPGGAMTIDVSPVRYPVEHRNIRHLHGLITNILAQDHSRTHPDFSLVPWNNRFGWAVYFADEQCKKLAMQTIDGVLFDKQVRVKFGAWAKLRAPDWKSEPRGHRKMRVDILTPVHIKCDAGKKIRTIPTNNSIHSALTRNFPIRLGFDTNTLHDFKMNTQLHIIESKTETARVDLGGKYNRVLGFTGYFIFDGNAYARWLMKCAAIIGLGAKTAFGFGRIRWQESM